MWNRAAAVDARIKADAVVAEAVKSMHAVEVTANNISVEAKQLNWWRCCG